jgi:predicted metal-dependent TIM-barrel fold hydrolase
MHKLVDKANYQIEETNVGELPKNMGYSNGGGYTMDKEEYYRLLELQGKYAQKTENGVIIHTLNEETKKAVEGLNLLIYNNELSINTLEKTIDNINKFPTLERCNTIAYFEENCLSVGVKDNQPIIKFSLEPTQFTEEKAKEICEKVTNGHGKHPIMGSKLDFSVNALGIIKDMINALLELKQKVIENALGIN